MFNRRTTTILIATSLAAALAILAVGPNAHAAGLPISSCGQTVTQSAVLTQDLDCAGTSGIVVGASGITIDLKGHVLKGDRLAGHYGVHDIYDDVTIKNGVVRNFEYGLFVVGPANGVAVSNVVATGNTKVGIYVVGAAAKIASSTAAGNGGTGVHVEGSSASATSSTAIGNGGNGIRLWGAAPTVKSSTASGNADRGIWLEGDSAKVTSAIAHGNGSVGISVDGNLASINSSKASGNAGIGISVSGDAAVLTSNRAEANGFAGGISDGVGKGIVATGSPTAPIGTKNVARGNDDLNGCSPSSLCPAVGSNAKGSPISFCEQTVTTNAYLTTDLVCSGDTGIVVGASGITIDLNGHTVQGDNSVNTYGVADTGGYDNVTIRNGVVRNFQRGIFVWGEKLTVSNVVAAANTNQGIAFVSEAAKIVSSTAARNGWAGIGGEADSASVTSSTAIGNGGDGIALDGHSNSIKSSTAVANNPNGIRLEGDAPSVVGSSASGNALYGVYVNGQSAVVKSNTSVGNASHGIAILGDDPTVTGNRANGNGLPGGVSDGFGLGIFATDLPVGTNVALGNDDPAECDPSTLC
jgi:hypothetical protein